MAGLVIVDDHAIFSQPDDISGAANFIFVERIAVLLIKLSNLPHRASGAVNCQRNFSEPFVRAPGRQRGQVNHLKRRAHVGPALSALHQRRVTPDFDTGIKESVDVNAPRCVGAGLTDLGQRNRRGARSHTLKG